MHKIFLFSGTLFAALSVALGAYGAHALKKWLPAESISSFQTAVQYQMYHALALLITGILYSHIHTTLVSWAGYCFIIGIILFSGSLYLLTWLKVTDAVGMKGIGMITPIGGIFFIVGWLLLLVAVIKGQF